MGTSFRQCFTLGRDSKPAQSNYVRNLTLGAPSFSPYLSLLTAPALALVLVSVMQIRIMRVRMNQFLVAMDVRMRFTGRIGRSVDMLVMLIMPVQMLMSNGLVTM